jgi:hypothetical protein
MKPKQRGRTKKATAENTDALAQIKARIEHICEQYETWEAATTTGTAMEALRAWEAMFSTRNDLDCCLLELSRAYRQGLDADGKVAAEAEALRSKVFQGMETQASRENVLEPIQHLSLQLAGLIEATIEGASGPDSALSNMREIAAALKRFAEPSAIEFSPHPQEPRLWSYIRCDLGPIFDEALTALRIRESSPHWDGGKQLERLRDEILRRLVAWEKGESTKPKKQDSADRTHEAPLYVEIDLAARTLTVGSDSPFMPSDSVWNFLKELDGAARHSYPYPKRKEWKNAYDMLRKKIGKEKLPFVVESTGQGYKLAASVKRKGVAQKGIRHTKQSR